MNNANAPVAPVAPAVSGFYPSNILILAKDSGDETSSDSNDDYENVSLDRSYEQNKGGANWDANGDRRKPPQALQPNSMPVITNREYTSLASLTANSSTSISQAQTGTKPRSGSIPLILRPALRKNWSEMATEDRRALIQANNSLMAAAENGNFKEVADLIKSGVDINTPDLDGLTALHHAARKGMLYVVDLLVRSGASMQAATPEGYTALALAASQGNGAVVEYLIPYHFSGTQTNRNRNAPKIAGTQTAAVVRTSRAASADLLDLAVYESAAQAYIIEGESDNVKQLVDAVYQANLPAVARMLAAQCRKYASGSAIPKCMHIEETDKKGRSLLAIACAGGHDEIAMLLLCAGASVDGTDNLGNTPLIHAVAAKKARTVAVLLKAGARWDITNSGGSSALAVAINQDDLAVLQALVQGNVDIWKATAFGHPLIIYAAHSKKVNIVRELLQRNADIADERGSRALAQLARTNDPQSVRILLKAGANPQHRAADGHTAFTLAAANGHDEVLSVLIKHHGTPEWKKVLQAETDNLGRTALMLATLNKKEDTVSFLLKNHADPHQQDRGGRNALLWAAAKASPNMLRLLIDHGATHVCADKAGNTIFIMAAEHDNRDVLRVICAPFYKNSLFDINTPNKEGDTALIKAARCGLLETVKLLLDNGANLLHTNHAGRTAILEAGAAGHTNVAVVLQEKLRAMPQVFPFADAALTMLATIPLVSSFLPERAPVRARELDERGNTMMMLAAGNGHHQLLNDLLGNVADDDGRLAFNDFEGSESESFSLEPKSKPARLASPSKMDIEAKNLDELTALGLAAREGHYATVKLLIDNGAKVGGTMCTYTGHRKVLITPLWLAAKLTECAPGSSTANGSDQMRYVPEMLVDLLLKNGADSEINTPSWHGQPPLVAAAGAGRAQVVALLLDHGALLEASDEHKLTPLMHAAYHGHLDVVKLLLDRGASAGPGRGSLSALILSAERGHDRIISLLLERGADIDQADEFGDTPLIGAAKNGQVSTVRLLISRGANLYHTNERNKNALQYAVQRGHSEIVSLLESGAPAPRDH